MARLTQALLAVGCALLLTQCSSRTTQSSPDFTDTLAESIKNGSAGNLTVQKAIFAFFSDDGRVKRLASGSNLKYKRCLLTAAHIAEFTEVYKGEPNVRDYDGTGKSKRQTIVKRVNRDATTRYTDLAVVWLENKKGTPAVPRMTDDDYYPLTINNNDLGLTGVVLPRGPNSDPDPKRLSPGAPKIGFGFGFGANWSAGGGDTGQATVRSGSSDGIHFIKGADQTPKVPGAYYVFIDDLTGWRPRHRVSLNAACPGDSGGGVTRNGGIGMGLLGVVKGGPGGILCKDVHVWYAVAVDDSAPPREKSNKDWANDKAEEGCKKNLKAGIKGQGRIYGRISPPQDYPQSPSVVYLNNEINLAWDGSASDDIEFFHDGQQMPMVASADPGWHFDHWEAIDSMHCQCDGSTDTTCSIVDEQMGTYTEDLSDDNEGCNAVFSSDVCQGGQCSSQCPCYVRGPYCGDGVCNNGETCATCEVDCGSCPRSPRCGDGVCDIDDGETCDNCPQDCGTCPVPPVCGDGICELPETCYSCPADCDVCGPPPPQEPPYDCSHPMTDCGGSDSDGGTGALCCCNESGTTCCETTPGVPPPCFHAEY